jgi:hypothetical protein
MAEGKKETAQVTKTDDTKSSGKAVGALVCGICSIAIGTWCCFLWLPLGIVAMVLGKQEERAIAEGRSSEAGKSMAQWGFWLGLASLILGVVLNIIFMALGIFGTWMENVSNYY